MPIRPKKPICIACNDSGANSRGGTCVPCAKLGRIKAAQHKSTGVAAAMSQAIKVMGEVRDMPEEYELKYVYGESRPSPKKIHLGKSLLKKGK